MNLKYKKEELFFVRDLEKVEKIEKMVASGVDHEVIKDVLELKRDVADILDEAEVQKGLLTTQQVSDKLTSELKGKVKGVFDTQKINRLRKDGSLQPVKAEPTKREGYRYSVEEVERFIASQLISKDKLIKEKNDLEKKFADAKKEIANLKRKIKTFETKEKKQKEEESKA